MMLDEIGFYTLSDQREDIGKVVRSTSDFRAGVIYSTQNAWPYVKVCVDIACVNKRDANGNELQDPFVLLGKKASENKWRLPGGMVDKGESIEEAAFREFREETGLTAEISKLKYIGSFPAGDWRYKNVDEIGLLTILFLVEHLWGAPKAGDDLIQTTWCPISKAEDEVVKNHKTLIAAVKKNLNGDSSK